MNSSVSKTKLEKLKELNELSSFALKDYVADDLLLDDLYNAFNYSVSEIGEEYLYSALHKPDVDESILAARSELADEFNDSDNQITKVLSEIPKSDKRLILALVDSFSNKESLKPAFFHLGLCLLFIASFISIFISEIGILICLVIGLINCVLYFNRHSQVLDDKECIKAIICWLNAVKKLPDSVNKKKTDCLLKDIKSQNYRFNVLFNACSICFVSKNALGSLFGMLFDYINFLTHIDLIAFYVCKYYLSKKNEELKLLYKLTGELELGYIISNIRQNSSGYCIPDFTSDECLFNQVYHPLISEPVKNDINLNKGLVITGSNASGKSTFLKAVSINILLAQTIYTCFADKANLKRYKILSSIYITDSLKSGDSFYISEIKRIKMVIDELDSDSFICLDEILRGTNTKERIAASSQILKYFADKNATIIAATHDVEVAYILENILDNYYFKENPKLEKIFDYKLYKGVSYESNAIKILERFEFPREIIDNSLNIINKN